MATAVAQPIAGVSATREAEIEIIYPSVASTGVGQLIGGLMGAANSLPFPLNLPVVVIVGALLAPLGLLVYLLTKIFGNRYLITNRTIQVRKNLTGNMSQQVGLGEIATIEIGKQASHDSHRVGDVRLLNAQGNELLILPGISHPERLRQIIYDARNARVSSDESLSRIQSRS